MNKDVIITESEYLVSTDSGTIKVIHGNDDSKILDILEKENEVEILENDIDNHKERIINENNRVKEFNSLKKMCVFFPISGFIPIACSLLPGNHFTPMTVIIFIVFTGTGVWFYSEINERVNQIRSFISRLHQEMTEYENKKERLEDSLVFDKVKARYEENNHELDFDESLSRDNVKVLKLTKR